MKQATKIKNNVHLYHDNCLNIIKRLKVEIDLTFLDPPFNQGKEYISHNDEMPVGQYWEMMKNVCQDIYEKTSTGGAIYFMQREKNAIHVLNTLESTDWTFQNMIIWRKKTSAVPMIYRHGKQYQIIVFATKSDKPRLFNKLRINPEMLPSYKQERSSGIFVTDVWDDIRELTSGYFAGSEPIVDENGRFHKQQTSLGLLLRIILTSTKQNDTVLDPFSGTGTTSLVATQLQRNSIAIENALKNIKCIKDRLSNIRDVDKINRFYDTYEFTKDLDEIWANNIQTNNTL